MASRLGKRKYFLAKALNLALICVVLASFSGWAAQAAASDAEVEQQIREAERAASRGQYPIDGVFEGSAQGFGGMVTMRVTIQDGYIDQVEIADASSEDEAWLNMCLGLPDAMVKAQSSSVDTISGATYTSVGMINGTTEALRKSIEGEAQ